MLSTNHVAAQLFYVFSVAIKKPRYHFEVKIFQFSIKIYVRKTSDPDQESIGDFHANSASE